MRLEQRLTPQLIQSMAILQKSTTDLEVHINEALESNAALELAEPERPAVDQREQDSRSDSDGEQRLSESSFNRLDRLTRAYDLDGDSRAPHLARRVARSDEPDAKMGALANTEGRAISLQEHLLAQWGVVDISEEVDRAGEAIIAHLDPDGLLRIRLDEIAEAISPTVSQAVVEEALTAVQQLEPVGVGARDLVECLLLQLDSLPGDNAIERVLIENHLDDIARNRLPAVVKATGFSMGEINEAINVFRQNLVLHPGFLVGDRSVPTIRPDVVVEYADTGGGLTVRLVRGNSPELRIRDDVATMAKSKENGKEMREFARKQVEAAAALIDAVQFRQSRLLEVSGAIVEKQREFFDVGPDGLKVLRMSDLAEELECDPSTISRTVAEKYMQTPRGIYPLRYFFTGGTQTEDGESVGWNRVKAQVKDLVESEDPKYPLNDDQIAGKLRDTGVDISRRTVAKYRQQMSIPTARRRRKF